MSNPNGNAYHNLYNDMDINDISYTIDKKPLNVQCDVYHKNNRLK